MVMNFQDLEPRTIARGSVLRDIPTTALPAMYGGGPGHSARVVVKVEDDSSCSSDAGVLEDAGGRPSLPRQ